MTQMEYLQILERRLGQIPQERRTEIMSDIRAHFEEGAAAGVSEETLCEGLGSPEALAREYRATHLADRAQDRASPGNVMRAVWAGIGMGMVNLILALPVGISIYAVYLALLVSGVAMALSGIIASFLSLVNMVIPLSYVSIMYPWPTVFAGIAISALGALLTIGMLFATGALGRGTVKYIKANIDIVAGRRKKDAAQND